MEAFYVSIIFLGVLLVIGSLFFIVMDKVNGKDFFKEFDRKKEEMFNLIQDSEEMVQELNRISDYVVTVISEKNQEFFNKMNSIDSGKNTTKPEKAYNDTQHISASPAEEIIPTIQDIYIPSQPAASDSKVQNSSEELKTYAAPQNSEIYEKNSNHTESNKSRLGWNTRRTEVLKMIEQGMSDDEIADKLKIGKGEIGLIRVLSK